MLREHHILFKNIRASSLVFPFGVGAMMDLPEGSFMTATCDLWNKKDLTIVHDERLEKILRVKGFKSPVVKMDDVDKKVFIPSVQFPTWMFCPKCRSLKALSYWQKQYRKLNKKDEDMIQLRCPVCKVKLSPSRIVVACEHGHIDDFPWVSWVHYKNGKSVCKNPDLYIKTSGSSSGLEGITIECKTCNIKSNLSSAFNTDVFKELEDKAVNKGIFKDEYSLHCSGNRPWDGGKDDCREIPQTLQRGATNIYFPKVESSLLIPPYTEKVNNDVENSSGYNNLLITLEALEQSKATIETIKSIIQIAYSNISREIELPVDVVKRIVDRKLETVENSKDSLEDKVKYKEEEYRALIGEFGYDKIQQVDFKVEPIEGSNYNRNYINKVVLIHKLREVRALTGFSRINSPDANIMEVDEEQEEAILVRPLKDKTWYPAIEVRGEGIFIEFSEDTLRRWIKSNDEIIKRAKKINGRYNEILNKRGHTERNISAKFMFLHTFAHLIIKELSFKCGYSSTSLRERIYCNSDESGYNMSGILIYTANGDSEGTLGGLVRQGRHDRLNDIIDSAIEKARFCSSDPVCSESMGQGRDALNLSSCYSCTLISETSCEEFNTLLDRAMIVGTLEDESIGFFNFINN